MDVKVWASSVTACRSCGVSRGSTLACDLEDDVAVVSDASAKDLPERLTLSEAYRAAFHLVDKYIAVEAQPDVALVLLWQYLKTDPARWDDWLDAVGRALSDLRTADPLADS
jgi:hypothetical protein